MRTGFFMLIVFILLVAIFSPGKIVPQSQTRRTQTGGFYFDNAILPDPPMTNDAFLEAANTIQRPLTVNETQKVKNAAVNVNANQQLVANSQTVTNTLAKSAQAKVEALALNPNVPDTFKQKALSEQQQVLNLLAESQQHIDTLKISMDRSKNILMDLSAKLQSTDISSAESIRSLIKCPVCPLTEPGIMNYTDISAHHYKNQ
jgi:hypothetical protein